MAPKIQYLKDVAPELFDRIDRAKTNAMLPGLDIDKLGMGSQTRVYWTCEKHPDFPFLGAPRNIRAGMGCGVCTNRQVVPGYNSLKVFYPELAKEFSSENTVDPDRIAPQTATKVWWKCQTPAHPKWESSPNTRISSKTGCPSCSGLNVIQGETDLETTHPEVAKQWHPSKNKGVPSDYSSSSHYKAWWKCTNNHEWQAVIQNRTNGRGCAKCKKHGTSKIEARFRERLQAEESLLVFPFEPFKPHYTFGGYGLTIDIFFQAGEGYRDKYVVEYDGYYHNIDKARKRDIRKTNALLARGFKVIRIREGNLTHLDIEHENLLQLTYRYSTSPESLDPIVKQMLDWIELNTK